MTRIVRKSNTILCFASALLLLGCASQPLPPAQTAASPADQTQTTAAPLRNVPRGTPVPVIPAALPITADFGLAGDTIGPLRLGAPIRLYLDRRYLDHAPDGAIIVYRENDGALALENSAGGTFEGQPVARWRFFTEPPQPLLTGVQIDLPREQLPRDACHRRMIEVGRLVAHRFGKFELKPSLNTFGPLEYEVARKSEPNDNFEMYVMQVGMHGSAALCDIHFLVRLKASHHLFTLVQ